MGDTSCGTKAGNVLPEHVEQFLNECIEGEALKFGRFTLKSGRVSPYFFNAGVFHSGRMLNTISRAFAETLHNDGTQFDVLFGPAYKGIPLAAATLLRLNDMDEKKYGNISYAFNRKEVKDHGEGGNIVGSPLAGKRVIIIDDVITAGTAIRETISILKQQGAVLTGIIIAFDRQETSNKEESGRSAIDQVERELGIRVLSIARLEDLLCYVEGKSGKWLDNPEQKKLLNEYRLKYGVMKD